MANVKISALPAATTPLAGTEVLPIVQSGITSKVSVANLTAGRSISASDLTLTNALPIASGGTGQITANAAFNALAPSQTSNSGKYLTTDGTNTSWGTNPLGTVTSVSGTAPVSVATGTTTPVISMAAATTSVNGYLTSTDWTTFNSKQPAGTYVNSVSGTASRITSTGGTTPVIDLASGIATAGTTGSSALIPVVTIDTYGRVTSITTAANPQGTVTSVTGTAPVVSSGGATPAISMAAATTSVNGYLTSTDWTTFNNKGSGTVTSVTATTPITSTGGTTPVIAIPAATTSVNGYLTSTDWTTFNNKSNTNGTVTSVAAITLGTTGTDLSSTVATGTTTPVITLQVPTASASNRGALSAADWTTFNNKGSGTVTSVTGTAPVVSSGGATPAISMAAATTSVNGYLTSTDWTTFNNKGSGTVTSVAATVPTFLSVAGSPITTSGTLAITLSGTALPILNGGTGQTTAAAAFNALSPMTTTGDITYEVSANTAARLGIGTAGQVLTVVSGLPAWATSASTISTNLAGGTTGAIPYQSAVATTVFLSGNTSTTPNFYTSTGTGATAQAPTLTTSTGSGSVVLATSPNLVTPALGTPSALVGTNITGTASGLSIGGTATNATNTAITDDTTTATAVYPTFVTTTTGNLPQKTSSTKLSFVPSTGTLTTSAHALNGSTSGSVALNTVAVAGTNTATFPAATGTVMVSGNMPAFSVYPNSSQSLSSGVQKIQMAAETFDTNNCFDSTTNYRFTPTVAGYYQINALVTLGATSSSCTIYIYKNGSVYKNGTNIAASAYNSSSVSDVVLLNGSTDYIEFYVGASTSLTLQGTVNNTYASGAMIRSS